VRGRARVGEVVSGRDCAGCTPRVPPTCQPAPPRPPVPSIESRPLVTVPPKTGPASSGPPAWRQAAAGGAAAGGHCHHDLAFSSSVRGLTSLHEGREVRHLHPHLPALPALAFPRKPLALPPCKVSSHASQQSSFFSSFSFSFFFFLQGPVGGGREEPEGDGSAR